MSRARDDDERDGLTLDEACERFGPLLLVDSEAGGSTPCLHDADAECRYVPDHAVLIQPEQVPDDAKVCRGCDETVTIGCYRAGNETPLDQRRVCGFTGCLDEAFVIVEHPDEPDRTFAACPKHRGDLDVVREVGE
jgi:hypothetical protein